MKSGKENDNMKKSCIRICAAITAVMIIFTSIMASAATFSDVTSSTEYRDAITTLTTIGLIKGYEDGTFRPQNNITRAEFTTMIVRTLGLEDEQSTEYEIPFNDLNGHYARFNIKTAYDMGIINGNGDKTFRPDDNVTYEQAMKMVVCTLGYGESAMASGGYPMGYLTVGGNLGLTSGITINNDAPATRGIIAQIINNALEVKMLKPTVNVDGTIKYVASDETLLKTKLKVERAKVLVMGVGSSVITDKGYDDLKSYEMRVVKTNDKDDTPLIMDISGVYKDYDEAKKYVGHIIYIYYKDTSDSVSAEPNLLLAIDDQTQSSKEIEIVSRDIDSYDSSSNTLKYDDGSKNLKSIKVKPDELSVVYNNKAAQKDERITLNEKTMTMRNAIAELLDPENENFLNGEIKLVDSEDDGAADVIFIMNYDVMVATSTPSSTDYRITDKIVSGNYLILDPDDDNYEVTITRGGAKVSAVTSLKANDVILYAKSADGDTYTLTVTSNAVTGAITDIDDDKITISGKDYYMTDECRKYIGDDSKIKVGATGTFYIDYYDNIVCATIESTSTSMSYAYVINISTNDETDYMRLFAPKASATDITKYEFEDKVSVNGSNTSSGNVSSKIKESADYNTADIQMQDKVYANSSSSPSTNGTAQLIKYGLKKNKISEIVTLKNDGGTGEINTESDKLVRYKPLAKYTYSANNNFSNEFYINSSTTIMYVPGTRTAKSDYHKYTASSIFKTNQSYWVEPYDVNESKVASLVLVYGNSSLADITKDTVMSVVAKTPTEVDISGETVNKLTLYNSSTSMVTKNTDDNTEFADVDVGDVIQYGQSNSNRLINRRNIIKADDVIEVLNEGKSFDWTSGKFEVKFINDEGNVEWDSETNTPYSRAFVANVLEAASDGNDSYIRVTMDGFDDEGNIKSDNEERYTVTSSTPIIRFNTSKDTVSAYVDGTTTKMSIDDLKDAKYSGRDCSKVFIYTIKGQIKFIMIYE